MEIEEFQRKSVKLITDIDTKKNVKRDHDMVFIHLIEEIGEIARQLFGSKVGRNELDIQNLKEEIGDASILLATLAHDFGIDLEEAISMKMDMIKERFDV